MVERTVTNVLEFSAPHTTELRRNMPVVDLAPLQVELTAGMPYALSCKSESDLDPTISIANLSLDPVSKVAKQEDKGIKLSNKEFQALYLLAQYPNEPVTFDELTHIVFGEGYGRGNARELVYRLKNKLSDKSVIRNIWGWGFMIVDENLPMPETSSPGRIRVNLRRGVISRDNKYFYATQFERKLLSILSQKPNEVIDRISLGEQIWGDNSIGDLNKVLVSLRKSLGIKSKEVLVTIKGEGIKLDPSVIDFVE